MVSSDLTRFAHCQLVKLMYNTLHADHCDKEHKYLTMHFNCCLYT